jgi:replicative DNA helicase
MIPLPVDADAEAHVLAALLTSPEAYYEVAETLVPDDFGVPAHALIYAAIQNVDATGKPIDVITVAHYLRTHRQLAKANGPDYIAQLLEVSPTIDHVTAHADIVAEKALSRRLVETGRHIAGTALAAGVSGAEALEQAEAAVFALGATRSRSSLTSMPQAIAETMGELTKARSRLLLGHPTGFADLDRLSGGFQGGQLITIAARPGMGKSAFALQLASHIAGATGLMVPFLSYEMSLTELTMRLLATTINYDLHRLRQGDLPASQQRDLAVAAEKLAELPLLIDANPPSTIAGVRSAMRRLARRGQIGAIFVDYMQLMEGDSRFRDANRTQEVSDISRGLKRLATELDVPVIALSQLNRQLEARPNKHPMLSDLRESGSIEQDSSLVLFLYRDHLYNPLSPPNGAEAIIAKQRNGPSGVTFPLVFDANCARFRSAPRDVQNAGLGAGNGPF